MSKQPDSTQGSRPPRLVEGAFDVAVVGAGVVGCAVARRFAMEGAKVVVLERASDTLDGASKANSAILHTGFDAPPGSLEQSCIAEGYQDYLSIRERLGLPLLSCGALVLAWSDAEEGALDGLMERARQNGVTDIRRLSREQITAREPNLSPAVRAGFLVPRESVIDPWTTPYLYLMQAIHHGATVLRGTELRGGRLEDGLWRLDTARGTLTATLVINCAGLRGDLVERRLLGESAFEIRPRKGQFVVYDKAARGLIDSILLPVPSETTKGVVVCPTIFGNLLVGPTAEEQEDREKASVDGPTLERLKAEGERILPGLKGHLVTATYAGLRPASERKDYRIDHQAEKKYCRVGGIRSTGLSAALGIAARVFRRCGEAAVSAPAPAPVPAPPDGAWPSALPIAECVERDWQRAGNGGIVCHCELVTRREIQAALSGPLAARSLAALKRRTRATMGRCQGFFCTAEIASLTAGRFEEPLGWAGTVGEPDSGPCR